LGRKIFLFFVIIIFALSSISCGNKKKDLESNHGTTDEIQHMDSKEKDAEKKEDFREEPSETGNKNNPIEQDQNVMPPSQEEKTVNIPEAKISFYKPQITDRMTWPDIYGDKVVFANYRVDDSSETRKIHLLDISTMKEDIIYTPESENYTVIDDVRIGSEWVFWKEGEIIEGDIDFPDKWAIKAYNLKTKKVKTLREGSFDKRTSLVPRVDNDDNTVVWLEGICDDNDNLHHYIYTYDFENDRAKRLADVNYWENPFRIVRIRDNVLCFPDKIDDEWVIRVIDLSTNQEKQIIPEELQPGESVESSVSDKKKAAWEVDDRLYLYDYVSGETALIDNDTFLFDIHNGDVIFTRSDRKHHVYKYYSDAKVTECLTEKVDKGRKTYYEFLNCYGDTIVCIDDRYSQPQAALTIIQEENKQ